MTVLLLILVAILTLTVVSGIYLFVISCVRRKEIPWLVEKEISRTPYGKFSNHIQEANHWLSVHNAKDIWIESHDHLRLHALWVPAENPKGTIILVHGYRSCPLLDFGLAFDYYYHRGLNLLVPDQRSHGKSDGRFITFGVKESQDIQRWITHHNRYFGSVPIMLSGLSMGASTVLYLANRELPQNVKGIIADCGFTSPNAILARVFRDVTRLPPDPSVMVAEFCARCFANFSLWDCDTRHSLSKARLPVVMIHGKDDMFVPCVMSEQGYEACISPKQLLLVDGADHGVSFLVEPDKYKQLVSEFLDKYIS